MKVGHDIVGSIAILKFEEGTKNSDKIKYAKKLLRDRKSLRTVVEKAEKVKGRLRTIKTTHIFGEKNKVAEYVENGCKFRFNIETCYFSPRLSNERKEIYRQVGKGENVLVLFAGAGPFSIAIAKNAKPKSVYSVELGKECSKYAKENCLLNKVNHVHVIRGDVKKVIPKLIEKNLKFDRIVMPRPNLKDSFLESAFKVIKKGGVINYYGFSKEAEEVVEVIKNDAKESKKKIEIILVKKAGDIAPYKFRYRVDFRVL